MIEVNDLVVCIGDDFLCKACEEDDGEETAEPCPERGQILKVRQVICDDFPCLGLLFFDFPDAEAPFAACLFRKIEKADEEFIKVIKACYPVTA